MNFEPMLAIAIGVCNRQDMSVYVFFRTCQGNDWDEHKMKCRKGRPTPVGLPFIISLPASRLTYSTLASMAEQFAR